jgi:hypothetical protein
LKNGKATTWIRISAGVLCTGLLVASVESFDRGNWREYIITFVVGILSGYYFTSAWYESHQAHKKNNAKEE